MAAPIKHVVATRYAPGAVLISCTCGWSRQISRRQNALARAQKVKAAIREHYRIADAQQGQP